MTEPPRRPTPLNYRSPPPREERLQSSGSSLPGFFGGLIVGSVVSGFVWLGGWKWFGTDSFLPLMVIVPGIKFVLGFILACIPGWRSRGAGLLVSIAIGFLIFAGACFGDRLH